jgi:hypothetical protein
MPDTTLTINSHIVPKRMGDAMTRAIHEQFQGAPSAGLGVYNAICGITLMASLDKLFDIYELGLRRINEVCASGSMLRMGLTNKFDARRNMRRMCFPHQWQLLDLFLVLTSRRYFPFPFMVPPSLNPAATMVIPNHPLVCSAGTTFSASSITSALRNTKLSITLRMWNYLSGWRATRIMAKTVTLGSLGPRRRSIVVVQRQSVVRRSATRLRLSGNGLRPIPDSFSVCLARGVEAIDHCEANNTPPATPPSVVQLAYEIVFSFPISFSPFIFFALS